MKLSDVTPLGLPLALFFCSGLSTLPSHCRRSPPHTVSIQIGIQVEQDQECLQCPWRPCWLIVASYAPKPQLPGSQLVFWLSCPGESVPPVSFYIPILALRIFFLYVKGLLSTCSEDRETVSGLQGVRVGGSEKQADR